MSIGKAGAQTVPSDVHRQLEAWQVALWIVTAGALVLCCDRMWHVRLCLLGQLLPIPDTQVPAPRRA